MPQLRLTQPVVIAIAVAMTLVPSSTRGQGAPTPFRPRRLIAGADTMDTFGSVPGGPIERGNGAWYVRTVVRNGSHWELSDTWHDSTGRVTARQYVRVASSNLTTEEERVRADGDSASMLVTSDHITAWVVPVGQPVRLFDGPGTGDRWTPGVFRLGVAAARPAVGEVIFAPTYALYGANPLKTSVDTIRVVKRSTVKRGGATIPVVMVERGNGVSASWFEESTGRIVAARGNAGPNRYWWHVLRGVTPPE
jgi:hypothetical protein